MQGRQGISWAHCCLPDQFSKTASELDRYGSILLDSPLLYQLFSCMLPLAPGPFAACPTPACSPDPCLIATEVGGVQTVGCPCTHAKRARLMLER